MQMNPKFYYDNFVKPNYDEFCADEGSLRKAFNAVVSFFHMTDNYFNVEILNLSIVSYFGLRI